MFEALLEQVRVEVSGERALESVRSIARHHRVQASPGYDDAARWLVATLESYGYTPEIESVAADGRTRLFGQLMPQGWDCARAVARLVGGAGPERLCDYADHKLSLVLRSAPARGRFPLIAVVDGSEPEHYDGVDVRGRVVLTGAPIHRALDLAVRERGAAGLLFDGRRLLPPVRDRLDDPDALTYTSFWWGGDETRGWGFVVSPRRGDALRQELDAGRDLELEVEIESRAFDTTIPLVSAVLPGSEPDEVLILSHLCHPQPSANDNASGAAAALETARVLARLRERGELRHARRGVRFLWMPELTGTCAWIARGPERTRRIVAALNLDMVGEDQDQCGSTFLIEHPPCFAASFAEDLLSRIRTAAQDWVPTYSGPGHFSMTRMAEVPYSGGSDHAVLIDPAAGVPCPMLIQWPDRFYHSSHDTPDRCDPRSLALAARCAATYAGFLATAGEAESEALADSVARGARRRVLGALDGPDPARRVWRERIRGRSALESLSRLGLEAARLTSLVEALDAFVVREAPAEYQEALSAPGPAPGAARPRRRHPGPLDFMRRLLPGFAELPPEERERWRSLESSVPAWTPLLDLAWQACDGRRSVAEITGLVEVETGARASREIEEFFQLTERMGLTEWTDAKEVAWSSSGPGTATR